MAYQPTDKPQPCGTNVYLSSHPRARVDARYCKVGAVCTKPRSVILSLEIPISPKLDSEMPP